MGETRSTDYSSYEYQHVEFSLDMDDGSGSTTCTGFVQVDPLEDQGGLETHEVAELVGMYREVVVEPDDFADIAPQDNGNIETRGVFGVDLNSTTDLIADGANSIVPPSNDGILEADETDASNPDLTVAAKGHDKNEVFDHFQLTTSTGFQDSGAGAGSFTPISQRTVNFRETLGAGPIIDANDSISCVLRLIKNNTGIKFVGVRYRVTLIWDIAQVEDAGRRFGIPN